MVLETIPENGWNGTDQTAVTPTSGIYHIKNGAELAWFAAQVNAGTGKTYKAVLDNDIDLCGYNWTPIGTSSKKFAGEFDGQGFTIDNLYIVGERYLGLFGALTYNTATAGVVIKNFVLRGSIESTFNSTSGANVGAIAGQIQGAKSRKRALISNVTNYVNIIAYAAYVSGLIGQATFTDFDRCANYGNVMVTKHPNTSSNQNPHKCAAGIVVGDSTIHITNSYNCGNIVTGNYAGGLFAGKEATADALITNCYNTGYVNASKGNNLGAVMGAIRTAKNTTDVTPRVTNAYSNADFLFNELNTIIVDDEEPWQSGEIAYKLGDAYGQQIGVDPLPVLGGMKVYEKELNDGRIVYSNDPYKEYIRDGLTAGNMGTVCLPWASELYCGATFYIILYKELDNNGDPYNITLEEVTTLEPGVPYVFVPNEDAIHVYYFSHTEVLTPSVDVNNGLYGTFDYITDGAAGASGNKLENNYVVYNNMFQKCGGYCQLPANRAYIKMDKVPVQGAANAPKPKAERRHIVIGNAQKPQTPTSIDNIVTDAENTAYDILGRPVDINNAVHGVYIINGQKVIK